MKTFQQLREDIRLHEIANIDKWWYNANTKKVVVVKTTFHVDHVFEKPKDFGLTEKQVDDLADAIDASKDLDSFLKKKGWVEVTWLQRNGEVVLRALKIDFAQKSLKWFLDKIQPNPKRVSITILKKTEFILRGSQIDQFARTGQIIRQTDIGRTMARFR